MTLLSVIAIIVAGLALTLTSILLVRTFVPRKLRGREQKRGIVFAFCGVIYALVVGFVLAFALQGYQQAESDAAIEADSVTSLSRSATLFDAESRDHIGHELICYARSVIYQEWPAMRSGNSSDLTVAASDRLFHSFGSLGSTHSNDAALSGSLDRIREMDEARASRLIKSDQQLPAMFWVFMIGGGLLLIGYSTILSGRESFFGQILFIMPVSLLLLCSVYLVVVFEQPFKGPNAIKPAAMEVALESVDRFVPDPRANRPCP